MRPKPLRLRETILLLTTVLAGAQPLSVAVAEFTYSTNRDNLIVVHADGQRMRHLELKSASGSLVPATSPAPFQSLVRNTPAEIIYTNTEWVNLEGNLTLSAGWNPSGQQDIFARAVSRGERQPLRYDTCQADCALPFVEVGLDDANRFVVTGHGHELTALEFTSNRSLVPATTPAPFSALGEANTPQHVSFRAPDGITLDGSVTLSSGWEPSGGVGDVIYGYTEKNGARTVGLHLPNQAFPQESHLDANVNDQNQLVVRGSGHRINNLAFSSRSGSLVPGNSPSPFQQFTASSPAGITWDGAGADVVIDGTVTLDATWDAAGKRDLFFAYQGAAGTGDGAYYLSRGNYPSPSGRPEIWLSLDKDYRFLVHTDLDLVGLNITSEDEALVPGAAGEPFEFLLSNNKKTITYVNLGPALDVEGSIKLTSGWNPLPGSTSLEVEYLYEPRPSSQPIPLEVLPEDLALCPDCEVPDVSFAEGGQVNLVGFEVPLTEVEVTSASGALQSVSATSELTVEHADQNRIVISADAGLDAFAKTELPLAWSFSGSQDVLITFTTVDGDRLGPFPLPSHVYEELLPEPSGLGWLGIVVAAGGRWRRRQTGRRAHGKTNVHR